VVLDGSVFFIIYRLNKSLSLAAEAFSSLALMLYFTLAKMITSVYNASDSIRARPRISAN
jgi:hypothetical protein